MVSINCSHINGQPRKLQLQQLIYECNSSPHDQLTQGTHTMVLVSHLWSLMFTFLETEALFINNKE